MNTQQLLDFLDQQKIALTVESPEYYFTTADYDKENYLFVWHYGTFFVSVWTLDVEGYRDEKMADFTINDQTLSNVLEGIRKYRTVGHS